MTDYILYLKVCAWIDAYFLPSKMHPHYEKETRRQDIINASFSDVLKDGYACISQFNSITGKQEYFRETEIL